MKRILLLFIIICGIMLGEKRLPTVPKQHNVHEAIFYISNNGLCTISEGQFEWTEVGLLVKSFKCDLTSLKGRAWDRYVFIKDRQKSGFALFWMNDVIEGKINKRTKEIRFNIKPN